MDKENVEGHNSRVPFSQPPCTLEFSGHWYGFQNNSDDGMVESLRVAMFGLERALYLEPKGFGPGGDRSLSLQFL